MLDPVPLTFHLWSKEGKEGERYLLQIHLENNPLNYSFITLRDSRGERSPWLPLEMRPDSPGVSRVRVFATR